MKGVAKVVMMVMFFCLSTKVQMLLEFQFKSFIASSETQAGNLQKDTVRPKFCHNKIIPDSIFLTEITII